MRRASSVFACLSRQRRLATALIQVQFFQEKDWRSLLLLRRLKLCKGSGIQRGRSFLCRHDRSLRKPPLFEQSYESRLSEGSLSPMVGHPAVPHIQIGSEAREK